MIPAKTWNQRTPRFSHSRIAELTSSPGTWCTHARSTTTEYEIAIPHRAPGTSLRPPDTGRRPSGRRSSARYRTRGDIRLAPAQRQPGAARSGRPGLCSPTRAATNPPAILAFPVAPARRLRACLDLRPEHGSKYASSAKPFLQPDIRDLSLFFGCLAQLGCVVVPQAASQNVQHLSRRLPGRTHDEHPAESLFVTPIRVAQSHLDCPSGCSRILLLLRRPLRGLRRRRPRCISLADPRMFRERIQPVRCWQAIPDLVRGRQERRFIHEWPVSGQLSSPRRRTAAIQDLLRRLPVGKPVPATQHLAHSPCPSPLSLSRNSATRFPMTAE